jgi:ATP-dependent DNA helicase RecG
VRRDPEPESALHPDDPPTRLRGAGPALARRLAAAGVHTLRDLLCWFPKRARELEVLSALDPAAVGRWVRVAGRVVGTQLRYLPGRRSVVTVQLAADDGQRFRVALFNRPYLKHAYAAGERRWVEGVLVRRGREYELQQGTILADRVAPSGPLQLRYPSIEGVSEQRLAGLIQRALRATDLSQWPAERVPPALHEAHAGQDVHAALRAMHAPASAAEHDAARVRFAALEAVALFRRVERARRRRLARRGPPVAITAATERRLAAVLPFAWTRDQAAALAALRNGLSGPSPLGLLVQGDVGTGKTAVALWAALAVIEAGWQAALLAPTELLAEQHFENLSSLLAASGVRIRLMTAGLAPGERDAAEREIASGAAQLVVGTHALLSASTAFARLGLVVIDEQHRFGVEQRMQLVHKGDDPHVLVMTATPIPRTLSLALFGDLDHVTLRERPVGRAVPAVFVPPRGWPRIVRVIARHLARGEQAYVVCPRIGAAGEKGGAVRLHRDLSAHFPCGLVHGRLPAPERRAVTAAFRSGELRVLVGTTLLEVGVDVPNATLMVVIGADQLGLATLHQLRGRVGRGARRGLCVLTGTRSERVAAVCATRDGFALAEEDLRLRGAGELLGLRQSGAADLRALELPGDLDILRRAREAVRKEYDAAREAADEPVP